MVPSCLLFFQEIWNHLEKNVDVQNHDPADIGHYSFLLLQLWQSLNQIKCACVCFNMVNQAPEVHCTVPQYNCNFHWTPLSQVYSNYITIYIYWLVTRHFKSSFNHHHHPFNNYLVLKSTKSLFLLVKSRPIGWLLFYPSWNPHQVTSLDYFRW